MTPSRQTSRITWPLWWLAALATMVFLREAASLCIPIVVALLIASALSPLVAALRQTALPNALAVVTVMALTLGALGGGVYATKGQLREAVESLPDAVRRGRELIAAQWQSGPTASLQEAATEWNDGATAPPPAQPPLLQRVAESAMALAGHATVVVFLVFFLLLTGPQLRERIIEAGGDDVATRARMTSILRDIDAQVQRFLLVQAFTAALVAFATWGVLAWLGVEHALMWGLLAGVFNSIPYFGPIIVCGGLFVVGLTQGGGAAEGLRIAGASLVITSLEGWLLNPLLMGRAERMNVLTVFVGLLVWTWIWGAWGTVLAIPLLAVVKSVADHVPAWRRAARLMAA